MCFFTIIYLNDIASIDYIEIEIDNVRIKDLKLSSAELELKVKISNPTNQTLSDLMAEFNIFISNIDVGDGLVEKVTILPNSEEISDVLITIFYADVGQAVINGLQSGNFDLLINGEAKLNVLFNLITISKPFSSVYSYK